MRLLLALAILGGTAVDAKAAGCHATVPADLGPGVVAWIGPCSAGQASGVGVLKAPRKDGTRFFFGRMSAGVPQNGVVQTATGDYIPIRRFDDTMHRIDDQSGDRASSVATFNIAASGAHVASTHFSAAGNRVSATFYARRAKALAEQLD